ncbi:hypothetical protein LQG66_03875 [Bradyrhizobium ontarionense]|uniref:Uncharacterized protein n=1 Tax=Bradyrhizobium ontarionense TaxID=2898149 RepID=A0ABY3RDH2_9BRAD|nr:hypothetical protein [Bradyrhizobium sp. A19]UFZ05465.1 hypothetical protein LQG66_03875 [Bradyrhizobium sp. A19]
MTALTADRATPRREKPIHAYDVAASTKIWAGALVVLASGYAKGGVTATGLIAVGRCEKYVDNSSGANGDLQVTVQSGVFRWNNSASTDLIARTEIGSDCYIVDDNTVAKTNGSSTRSVAGKVVDVDALGVWVATGPGNIL